jgi:hypothetical protein
MSQSELKITKDRRRVWCKKDGGVVGGELYIASCGGGDCAGRRPASQVR